MRKLYCLIFGHNPDYSFYAWYQVSIKTCLRCGEILYLLNRKSGRRFH